MPNKGGITWEEPTLPGFETEEEGMTFRFCSHERCTEGPELTIRFQETALDFCRPHGLEVITTNPLWTSVTVLEEVRRESA